MTIEGFGEDPAAENCCLLTEIMGKEMDEVQISNLLAHNSFVQFGNTDSYNMPVNQFGAQPGASFLICPVIDNLEGAGNIQEPVADMVSDIYFSGTDLIVHVARTVQIAVYDISGCLKIEKQLPRGKWTIPANDWNKGMYGIRITDGRQVIGIKKILK